MRPLMIDEDTKDKIEALIAHAEKNPLSMDDLLDTMNKELAPAGEMDGFTMIIHMGYITVFSIEKQVVGDVRHLSVSVDADGKVPGVHAVIEIMNLFGFKNTLRDCNVWMEDISPQKQAINIAEIIK